MKGLRFIAEHKRFSLLMAVIVVAFVGMPVYGVVSGRVNFNAIHQAAIATPPPVYEGQKGDLFSPGQGPVGLLVSAPVVGCPTVDQAGLHTQNVPVAKTFAYATNAYGGFCAAVLYVHGDNAEFSSSKPVASAALYDVRANGQHMSYGLAFSFGTSLVMDNLQATSLNGVLYQAVPVALYVFSLPDTMPVSLKTAEAALPLTFTSQSGPYYPVIQTAGDYGLPQQASILDLMIQAPPMK